MRVVKYMPRTLLGPHQRCEILITRSCANTIYVTVIRDGSRQISCTRKSQERTEGKNATKHVVEPSTIWLQGTRSHITLWIPGSTPELNQDRPDLCFANDIWSSSCMWSEDILRSVLVPWTSAGVSEEEHCTIIRRQDVTRPPSALYNGQSSGNLPTTHCLKTIRTISIFRSSPVRFTV